MYCFEKIEKGQNWPFYGHFLTNFGYLSHAIAHAGAPLGSERLSKILWEIVWKF